MSYYVTPGYVDVNYVLGSGNASAGLYAEDGSWYVTVVSGSDRSGLYAPDGSRYVVLVDGSTLTGVQNPCGAWNVYVVTEDWTGGIYHPCGALVVSTFPYYKNTQRITVVSDEDETIVLTAFIVAWDGETSDHTADFLVSDYDAAIGDVVQLQRATVSDFSDAEDADDFTVTDIGDMTAYTATWPSSWAADTYYVRGRYVRGSIAAPWSDTETVTIS